jgi:hypothetical protein
MHDAMPDDLKSFYIPYSYYVVVSEDEMCNECKVSLPQRPAYILLAFGDRYAECLYFAYNKPDLWGMELI